MSKISSILIVTILVMQLVFLYLVINPVNVFTQLNSVSIINEISKLAQLPPNELPQIGIVGDKKNLADIEDVKKANIIDGEIYKDAANGDYVVGYSTRMVIYRPNEKKIIYDGQSPQQKLTATQQQNSTQQQAIISAVIKKTMEAKLIPDTYNAIPNVSVVTSPEDIKKTNDFYKDVQKDDLIATYTNPNLVVVYRPSANAIVKNGQIQVSIK